MPRTKPTLNIDVIGELELPPENGAGSYLESKQQNRFFIKPPNCDTAGDSVELLLIRNQWEREAMHQLQLDLTAHLKSQAYVNESRIRKFHKIQSNLRKKLVEASSFSKECDDKRSIAQKKVNEELERHETLARDIERYQESINELGKFREQLKSTVREFEPYERVMEDVVAESNIYVSIKDCMDRCDALMLTQVEINILDQEKVREIEEMHKHMTKVINDAASTVMGLQNDLAELDRSYTKLNNTCLRWERVLAHSNNAVSENDLQRASTIDGVRVMYVILCRRRRLNPTFQRFEVESELNYIKDEIELLQEVLEKCNKDSTKNTEDKEKYKK